MNHADYLDRNNRRESQNLLITCAIDTTFPWCTFGDFNDLLSNEENIGLVDHPTQLLNGFREGFIDWNLHDIPMEGYQYTWAKKPGKYNVVEERIDWGLAIIDWYYIFPNFKLINGLSSKSNHSLIILRLDVEIKKLFHKTLRFKNKWLLEPDPEEIVRTG